MTEQILANSTDILPSNLNIIKDSNPLEIHHLSSNKLNIHGVTSSSSIDSNTICCIETNSIAQSITDTNILIDDNHHIDIKQDELSLNITKCILPNDSDNDSFDDDDDDDNEDEPINNDSFYSSLSTSLPTNYMIMSCPICCQSTTLQSSTCCSFYCCNTCWRTHISTIINDGKIKISCISNECNKYLSREIIINFIRFDPLLHERYLKLYTNANQNPRAKTCKNNYFDIFYFNFDFIYFRSTLFSSLFT